MTASTIIILIALGAVILLALLWIAYELGEGHGYWRGWRDRENDPDCLPRYASAPRPNGPHLR